MNQDESKSTPITRKRKQTRDPHIRIDMLKTKQLIDICCTMVESNQWKEVDTLLNTITDRLTHAKQPIIDMRSEYHVPILVLIELLMASPDAEHLASYRQYCQTKRRRYTDNTDDYRPERLACRLFPLVDLDFAFNSSVGDCPLDVIQEWKKCGGSVGVFWNDLLNNNNIVMLNHVWQLQEKKNVYGFCLYTDTKCNPETMQTVLDFDGIDGTRMVQSDFWRIIQTHVCHKYLHPLFNVMVQHLIKIGHIEHAAMTSWCAATDNVDAYLQYAKAFADYDLIVATSTNSNRVLKTILEKLYPVDVQNMDDRNYNICLWNHCTTFENVLRAANLIDDSVKSIEMQMANLLWTHLSRYTEFQFRIKTKLENGWASSFKLSILEWMIQRVYVDLKLDKLVLTENWFRDRTHTVLLPRILSRFSMSFIPDEMPKGVAACRSHIETILESNLNRDVAYMISDYILLEQEWIDCMS